MARHKPLPPLPTSSTLATLSVESRNHRALLIKHFLTDIHEPGIENKRDRWVYVLEEVLDDLSRQLSLGDWLASIKRGRGSRSRRSDLETKFKSSDDSKHPENEGKEDKGERSGHHKPPSTGEGPVSPSNQLHNLACGSEDELRAGRLVLCVAPHGSRLPLPTEDSGFNILSANIGCIFSPGAFVLQDDESEHNILYGLNDIVLNANTRLIGGTFTLKGVNSPMQHMLLCKVLRLATYAHLALILEQHLLSDSGVEIKLPSPIVPSFPSPPTRAPSASELSRGKPRPRNSLIPSTLTNFFLRRSFSQRSPTIDAPVAYSDSLDIPIIDEPTPRKSFDGLSGAVSGLRLHRFSFMGDRRSLVPNLAPASPPQPFISALRRVEGSKGLLSTSAGVILTVPKLLVDLSEKERGEIEGQKRRLRGDERVALTSLLGWDGKDAEGRGMSGILGFVRHQQISVLCSSYIPSAASSRTKAPVPPSEGNSQEGSSAFTNSTATTSTSAMTTTSSNLPTSGLSPCEKPHWVTYQYYSQPGGDVILGDWVQQFTRNSNLSCDRPGCKFTTGQHERRVIHDGVRIVLRISEANKEDADKDDTEERIKMWASCAVCSAKTRHKNMDDGTYLLSYAKFIELLIYSPALCILTPSLCQHTTPTPGPLASLPPSRFNIIRHFSTAFGKISLALSRVEDIFELRVPRLQIFRGMEKPSPTPIISEQQDEGEADGARKKVLRKEIRKWWEGVSDHIDKIEKALSVEETAHKSLPRLPSVDDAYDVFDLPETDTYSDSITPPPPPPLMLAPLPPTAPNSPWNDLVPQESYFTTQSNVGTHTEAFNTPTVPPKDNSEILLATLRHNFQKIEQSLYVQLAKASEASLNDVRRTFLATAKGTQKRLKAWQKKHLGTAKSKSLGDLVAEEPVWWGKGCHAVPGGNIIVRENDWGSIIAHTLSTIDYQLELANMSMARSVSTSTSQHTTPRAIADSGPSSFFSVATGYKLFTSSSNQPDPDQEDIVWNEPEQYSAVISRKEHARDPTSMLSIRDVLRQATLPEQVNGTVSGSRFAVFSVSTSSPSQIADKPSSVKAKADVGLSMEAADGRLEGHDTTGNVETLLQELDNGTTGMTSSRPASIRSETISTVSSGIMESHIRRANASSIISVDSAVSNDSQITIGQDKGVGAPPGQPSKLLPPLPLKYNSDKEEDTPPSNADPPDPPPPTTSGFASTVASGISSAMRFVLSNERPSSPPPQPVSNGKKHHMLLADIAAVDGRPHIKYDWTIGKRLKFSCTVYYAKQFDMLRKRCGINDIFLKSLSTSANWSADGGKSKSNFWKTSDDRFIIKTLVDAWNVADLQVLVELAPSYFRYMDATASRATVLAKLIGVYTIEIRNLETGNVQSKVDLLVMENLFFGQKISKTFDLKGIQGRKVKTHGDTTKTLFDGEWIEGQQRTLTLVRPHSKVVLHEAIKSDAEFLSRSNIMDYSLLLGIDEEKKQIVCGLVDTIGSYTFAKTLEYKAKQGLQSGKEVTVMPPTEYQERFVNALEGYFVACPDKWSKPVDESKIISDPNLLPSVL